jgi:hypothetical protein
MARRFVWSHRAWHLPTHETERGKIRRLAECVEVSLG